MHFMYILIFVDYLASLYFSFRLQSYILFNYIYCLIFAKISMRLKIHLVVAPELYGTCNFLPDMTYTVTLGGYVIFHMENGTLDLVFLPPALQFHYESFPSATPPLWLSFLKTEGDGVWP